MLAPKFSFSRQTQYLQYCWQNIVFQALITALAALAFHAETFAQESNAQAVPSVKNAQETADAGNDNPVGSSTITQSEPPSQAPQNSPSTTDAENQAESSDNSDDEEETISPSEILNFIRKKRAGNDETDVLNDNLILSQSSAYIFLSRKRVRDSSENNLDNWLLSSFEGALYLSEIFPSFINVSPINISLTSDIKHSLSINKSDLPLLWNSDRPLVMSIYVNLPIPDSVTSFIIENNDEIISSISNSVDASTRTSIVDYFILALALLGFAILAYIIYRIIVWAFMLDQNSEYDSNKETTEEVIAPIGMDAFSEYFSQNTPDSNKE